jgi:hypothetical protein
VQATIETIAVERQTAEALAEECVRCMELLDQLQRRFQSLAMAVAKLEVGRSLDSGTQACFHRVCEAAAAGAPEALKQWAGFRAGPGPSSD